MTIERDPYGQKAYSNNMESEISEIGIKETGPDPEFAESTSSFEVFDGERSQSEITIRNAEVALTEDKASLDSVREELGLEKGLENAPALESGRERIDAMKTVHEERFGEQQLPPATRSDNQIRQEQLHAIESEGEQFVRFRAAAKELSKNISTTLRIAESDKIFGDDFLVESHYAKKDLDQEAVSDDREFVDLTKGSVKKLAAAFENFGIRNKNYSPSRKTVEALGAMGGALNKIDSALRDMSQDSMRSTIPEIQDGFKIFSEMGDVIAKAKRHNENLLRTSKSYLRIR